MFGDPRPKSGKRISDGTEALFGEPEPEPEPEPEDVEDGEEAPQKSLKDMLAAKLGQAPGGEEGDENDDEEEDVDESEAGDPFGSANDKDDPYDLFASKPPKTQPPQKKKDPKRDSLANLFGDSDANLFDSPKGSR